LTAVEESTVDSLNAKPAAVDKLPMPKMGPNQQEFAMMKWVELVLCTVVCIVFEIIFFPLDIITVYIGLIGLLLLGVICLILLLPCFLLGVICLILLLLCGVLGLIVLLCGAACLIGLLLYSVILIIYDSIRHQIRILSILTNVLRRLKPFIAYQQHISFQNKIAAVVA
jgi:hypothetical protein